MVQVHFSELHHDLVVGHLNAHVCQIVSDYLAMQKGALGGKQRTQAR